MLPTSSPQKYQNWNDSLFSEGYDSDGDLGLLPTDIREEEELLVAAEGTTLPESHQAQSETSMSPVSGAMNETSVDSMNVSQIRAKLRLRNLHITGRKSDLVESLKEAIRRGLQPIQERGQQQDVTRNYIVGQVFPAGCYWELMEFEDDPIEEESRVIEDVEFRPPTVPEEEYFPNQPGKRKYNTRGIIDRSVFNTQAMCPKIRSNGSRVVNAQGELVYEMRTIDKTVVNLEFVKKHNLGMNSHPFDWFQAFLPIKKLPQGKYSIEQVCTWTNTKA